MSRTKYTHRMSPGSIRHPGLEADWWPASLDVISGLIEYSDAIDGTATVAIGTIPAGARFLGCRVLKETAFDGGANNTLIVGIPGDTNYFIEDGRPTVDDEEVNETNILDYTPTSDVVVSAIYTHTGTIPTVGKVLVSVLFTRPL